MKLIKLDYFSFFLIFIISSLFVLELFLFPGRLATFDSNTHISTIAQFSQGLRSGDFPIVWLNNFANYGMPVGIITHQLTNYLGGFINLVISNPNITYNILVFAAIFLSNAFLYLFLRLYFSSLASFLGVFIFCFTPYRIFNVYVRGSMPEVFSAIFLPLILIAIYLFIVKRKIYGFFLLSIFIALLTLNHPMMLVVYSFLFIPYLIFIVTNSNASGMQKIKLFVASLLAIVLGVLTCSYYLLPLNLETKYLYYAFEKNHLTGSFLFLQNYFGNTWDYFTNNEIFTRGYAVQFGQLESAILILGFLYYIFKKFVERTKENLRFLEFVLFSCLLIVFFTTSFSDIFYKNLFFLNSIQFPMRFLSSLIFLPPILAALLFDKFPKRIIIVIFIFLVALFSFPQVYGKNFTDYPVKSYYFSKENLYSVLMNTIWSARSQDYPDRKKQIEIVDGKGKINHENIFNSKRLYEIDAATPLRLVDYTFYFPGWNLYIDGVKSNIEFQNPKYRGIITYEIPQGKHSVLLKFEDTKIRLLGKILSIFFIILLFCLFFLRKKINNKLEIYN